MKSCALILSRISELFPIIWTVQLEKSPRIGHPVGDGFHQCPTNLKVDLAQLVEQHIRNMFVIGSNPIVDSIIFLKIEINFLIISP